MTLVAFALRDDGADILTDSLWCEPQMMRHGLIDKCRHLPAWDMAVLGVGPCAVTATWAEILPTLDGIDGFDHLEELAPAALTEMWATYLPPELRVRLQTTVFHVGWSDRRQSFAAAGFDSADGFAHTDLTDHKLFVRPMPYSSPPAKVPVSNHHWRRLAERVHEDWTLISGAESISPTELWPKTHIGGDMVLTRLARGQVERQVVHTMPTHGRQWRRSLIGLLCEEGQMAPCICGTGWPLAACCAPNAYQEPCPCRSGQPFGRCCVIMPDDPRVTAYYHQHRRDFDTTRPWLAEVYRRNNGPEWPPAVVADFLTMQPQVAAAARMSVAAA